ncbi:developmental regulator [Pyrrhoderma noxium]|uniref:Developmental regulator n=1 Tax=Pyrrhoderma noxium TaxID=2282107 RepID=A0A286UP34_9AGAM|nr:developmental regulator [Pyrrhoderma noxium]
MIQVTNARRPSSSATAFKRDTCDGSEGSEQTWGSWYNDKHYSLEVIQHPIRARMCGFGDKDRRPLAPAAVAKMIVKSEDDSLVSVDDIDVAFFVVTVDLWSADGKQEMNLVLHPSSADRYVPTHVSKPRRRGNGPSSSTVGPDAQSSQPSLQALPPPAAAYAHAQHQSNYPGYPPQPPVGPENGPGSSAAPHAHSYPPYPPYPEHTTWGYPPGHYPPYPAYPGYPLPPYHHGRAATPGQAPWPPDGAPIPSASPIPPGYGAPYGAPPQPIDGGPLYATQPYGPPPVHYTYPHAPPPMSAPPPPAPPPSHAPKPPPSASTSAPPASASTSGSGSSGNQNSKPGSSSQNASGSKAPSSPSSTSVTLPRHSYTRTLVGPLSANAARLNDEHRKPGIFFLFQDLSIRTEGTFKLRLRLMNVGAHPAPESGANRVMTTQAPILAQTFTDSFTVYSAKRFPGVPDTTALSIAFGNQGQKLPLRNRHGSRPGRRRRREDSDGSEEDSDGA